MKFKYIKPTPKPYSNMVRHHHSVVQSGGPPRGTLMVLILPFGIIRTGCCLANYPSAAFSVTQEDGTVSNNCCDSHNC